MKSKIPLTKNEPDIKQELFTFIEKYNGEINIDDAEDNCVTYTFKNNAGDTLGLEFFFNSHTFDIDDLDLYLKGNYTGMVIDDEGKKELYRIINDKLTRAQLELEKQKKQKMIDDLLTFLKS